MRRQEDETFDIESINIETVRCTVLLNKKLVGTNPTLNDFESKSFVDVMVELKKCLIISIHIRRKNSYRHHI